MGLLVRFIALVLIAGMIAGSDCIDSCERRRLAIDGSKGEWACEGVDVNDLCRSTELA